MTEPDRSNQSRDNGFGSSAPTPDDAATAEVPELSDRSGATANGGDGAPDGEPMPVTDVPSVPGPVPAASIPPPPPPQPSHEAVPPPPPPGPGRTEPGRESPIPPYGHQMQDRPGPVRPRHLRRGLAAWIEPDDPRDAAATRRKLAMIGAAAAPFALIGLIIVGWAIDNAVHSGQVHRNVEMSGHGVGGASEETLPGAVSEATQDMANRDVVVVIKGEETPTDAATLGVTLDEQEMIDSAMDVGRSGSLLTRPFSWAKSFFSPRTVSPVYTVSETQISGTLQAIQNQETEDSATPVEPQVQLADDGQFVAVPGQPGTELDVSQAASDLLASVESSEDGDSIVVDTATADVAPSVSDEQAQELADTANNLTEAGFTLVADGEERALSSEQLRSWLLPVLTEERQDLDFDVEAADAAVAEVFSDLDAEAKDATVTLAGGKPKIEPSKAGRSCCGEDAGARVWEALESGQTELQFEVKTVEPELTTEEVKGWGIKEPVGGARAWRSGQGDVAGPKPGFTTFEVGTGGRAHNIRRMANEVNGAVIPPGGSFSINDHVGARECPPYRADAGAIRDGELIDECGGGTSQFATTMFNAAYWAGLDISGYKSHSRYFDRYPRGREATMGAPGSGLDVVATNNTPYGVLIQTSHEGDSVTVTLWSTQHIQVEDGGNSESESGHCTIVTNTRKRTTGGSSQNDTFTARYSKEEGEMC